MENRARLLRRPSEKRIPEKKPVFLIGLLTILLIVTYVFVFKTYEPVKSVMITGGIIVYPFTFLIIAYITKYYSFKESRRSIYMSAALFMIFMLLMMICVIPTPNNQTSSYNAVIQYLYTNDFFTIGEVRIFYPLLGQFFGLTIAYVVSHLLYATIYNAICEYTDDYLAMGLSIFIASIIDRLIFMPLLFAENLSSGVNTFDYFIKCLTSEFIAAIVTSIIMIVIYVIIVSIKKHMKKRQLNVS